MKSFSAFFAATLLLAFSIGASRAEDWTTTDGKVYRDVKVMKAEADAVTIICKDGGALVPLSTLPPDLQQRFDYDPAKAQAAADARAKANADSAKQLAIEKAKAKKLNDAKVAAYKAAQKKAHEAVQAQMNGTPNPEFDIADPNRYQNGDILDKPK